MLNYAKKGTREVEKIDLPRCSSYKEVGKAAMNHLSYDLFAKDPNQMWITEEVKFKLFGQKLHLFFSLNWCTGCLSSVPNDGNNYGARSKVIKRC